MTPFLFSFITDESPEFPMQDIITYEYSFETVGISCAVNVLFSVLMVLVIGRLFER